MPNFNLPKELQNKSEAKYTIPATPITISPQMILSNVGLEYIKPKLYKIGDVGIPDKAISTSYLGTPIFSNLKLYKNSDTTFTNGIVINTVLFDVSMTKNIIKTSVQGRNGSVKQYVSLGDYVINIKGVLATNQPLNSPKDQLKQLVEFCEVDESLVIVSDFLSIFKIHNIVIEDYKVGEIESKYNLLSFEIMALSDDPLELAISK